MGIKNINAAQKNQEKDNINIKKPYQGKKKDQFYFNS